MSFHFLFAITGRYTLCSVTHLDYRVYKPSKRICIRNINTADSGGVLA